MRINYILVGTVGRCLGICHGSGLWTLELEDRKQYSTLLILLGIYLVSKVGGDLCLLDLFSPLKFCSHRLPASESS